MSHAVLSLRDVFCVHRTPEGDAAALQGATLEARAGELICVLGPSGAGKSTLLRVIAGLQTPSAGDVLVLGRDIGRLPARSRAQLRHELFGFLGQSAEAALSPDLRVQDCVALPLSPRGIERQDRRARVAELLERVGLARRDRTLVVAPDGWVRLPPELLTRASIAGRARVAGDADGLVVSRVRAAETREPSPAAGTGVGSGAGTGVGSGVGAAVQLRSLVRSRGRGAGRRDVLDGLSHEIAPGQMTALTGRSGSGKTTLLRLIAGIDSPDAGELWIDGEDIAGWGAEARAGLRRERIGYLPQEPAPIPFLSAQENVVLALQLRGWPAQAARERAAAVLSRVGLADRARQRVARLSAGETQRVARALAGARGLLIVDEPTSRLDRANAVAVADLLAEAADLDRQTVICATHDPEVIARAGAVLGLG